MRAVVQRVSRAEVTVSGSVRGRIDRGLVVLLGAMAGDTDVDLLWMTKKILSLRIFPDPAGKMNLAVTDLIDPRGAILLISQFTVCADVRKGTRPSFAQALPPEEARLMLERAHAAFSDFVTVATGEFAAHMEVALVNEGPVTIWLDSRESRG